MNNDLIKELSAFDAEKNLALLELNKIESIQSGGDRDDAEAVRKQATDLVSRVEAARKALTSPLDKIKKQIMAREREVVGSLKDAVDTVTESLQAYYDNQLKVNETQEQASRAKYEEAIETANGLEELISIETERAVESVKIDDMKRGFSELVSWEVENLDAIPREFFILDSKLVGDYIKNGQTIAGIKITKKARRTGR